jgi:hypothetical protein
MVALGLLFEWLHRCPGSEMVREPLTVSLWQSLSVMDSLRNLKKNVFGVRFWRIDFPIK